MSSVAAAAGLPWEKVWDHPRNAALKHRRGDPNVLRPGDVLFVPEKEGKQEPGSTGARHRFRKKGARALVRLQLLDVEQAPRPGVDYVAAVDGILHSGKSDASGFVELAAPPDAKEVVLQVTEGDRTDEYRLALGGVDPVTEPSGICQRLTNLGYDCGGETDRIGPRTGEAVRAFQSKNGLRVTGEADGATQRKLGEVHGC